MNKFQWQSSELEWVERVRQLCIEIARAALADLPRLPESLSHKALPLVEQGQELLDAASHRGISESNRSHYPELEWIEGVRQFFLELSRLSLSEHPRFPEHWSQRALDLAEEAQDIQEAVEAGGDYIFPPEAVQERPSSDPTHDSSSVASLNGDRSPGLLLEMLQKSVKKQWANSNQPDAAEWRQLLNLLEIAQSLYLRVKE